MGALLLLGVCVGALYVQAVIVHGDVVHVLVLMAAAGWLAWRGFNGARTGATLPA